MQVDPGSFPVLAFQWIADRKLEGKLFSTGKWGQYALATFGARNPGQPGLTVGFDGRYDTCYPRSIVGIHFDFTVGRNFPSGRYRGADTPPPDPGRALSWHAPDYWLIDRREPHAVQVVAQHTHDWTLLYQDRLAQVWGRSTLVNDPHHARHVPLTDRQITDRELSGWRRWPAAPDRWSYVRHHHVGP